MASQPKRSPASLDELLRLLSASSRRDILASLAYQPRNVTGLTDWLRAERTHVTHDLNLLKRAGLVAFSQSGHWRVYRPGPCVRVQTAHGRVAISITAACSAELSLTLAASETVDPADADGGDASGGHQPEMDLNGVVTIPVAAALARRGSAPRAFHPSNGSGPA
jgi:DNA-binding transcriptional ArsR family regulator